MARPTLFMDRQGDLKIDRGGRLFKYCFDCSFELEAKGKRLKTHYSGHHGDLEPKWLPFEGEPVRCAYSNFEEFRKNTGVPLELTVEGKKRLKGRPAKSQDCSSVGNASRTDHIQE